MRMDRILGSWVSLAWITTFIVVGVGAYTRLTDAGLGCPDWPGCYGQAVPPSGLGAVAEQKAWTEMKHRYVAGALGGLILGLWLLNFRVKVWPRWMMHALVLLLVGQAALGRWTVTLRLLPLSVIGHLLGGFGILAFLWILIISKNDRTMEDGDHTGKTREGWSRLRRLSFLALGATVVQIILGGLVSASYAALVCPGFPSCHPETAMEWNIQEALNLFRASIPADAALTVAHSAKTTIHMLHRMGAVVVGGVVLWLCYQIFKTTTNRRLRILSLFMTAVLLLQLVLGITNVLALLPLKVALAHNVLAAVLLLCLVTITYHLCSKPQPLP